MNADQVEASKSDRHIRWSSTMSLETPATWAPHQRRVVIEHNELHDRLTKLEAFLASPTRPQIPHDELSLLTEQRGLMHNLRSVLRARMRLWGLPGPLEG